MYLTYLKGLILKTGYGLHLAFKNTAGCHIDASCPTFAAFTFNIFFLDWNYAYTPAYIYNRNTK